MGPFFEFIMAFKYYQYFQTINFFLSLIFDALVPSISEWTKTVNDVE